MMTTDYPKAEDIDNAVMRARRLRAAYLRNVWTTFASRVRGMTDTIPARRAAPARG